MLRCVPYFCDPVSRWIERLPGVLSSLSCCFLANRIVHIEFDRTMYRYLECIYCFCLYAFSALSTTSVIPITPSSSCVRPMSCRPTGRPWNSSASSEVTDLAHLRRNRRMVATTYTSDRLLRPHDS